MKTKKNNHSLTIIKKLYFCAGGAEGEGDQNQSSLAHLWKLNSLEFLPYFLCFWYTLAPPGPEFTAGVWGEPVQAWRGWTSLCLQHQNDSMLAELIYIYYSSF